MSSRCAHRQPGCWPRGCAGAPRVRSSCEIHRAPPGDEQIGSVTWRNAAEARERMEAIMAKLKLTVNPQKTRVCRGARGIF